MTYVNRRKTSTAKIQLKYPSVGETSVGEKRFMGSPNEMIIIRFGAVQRRFANIYADLNVFVVLHLFYGVSSSGSTHLASQYISY